MAVQVPSDYEAAAMSWASLNATGIKNDAALKKNQKYVPKLEINKKTGEVTCEKIPISTKTIFGHVPKDKQICLDNLNAVIKMYVKDKKPVPEFLLSQIKNYNKGRIFNRIDESKVNKAQAERVLENAETTASDLEKFVWSTKLKGISKQLGHDLLEKAKALSADTNIMRLIASKCSKADQRDFKNEYLTTRKVTEYQEEHGVVKLKERALQEGEELLKSYASKHKIDAVMAKAMQQPSPQPPPESAKKTKEVVQEEAVEVQAEATEVSEKAPALSETQPSPLPKQREPFKREDVPEEIRIATGEIRKKGDEAVHDARVRAQKGRKEAVEKEKSLSDEERRIRAAKPSQEQIAADLKGRDTTSARGGGGAIRERAQALFGQAGAVPTQTKALSPADEAARIVQSSDVKGLATFIKTPSNLDKLTEEVKGNLLLLACAQSDQQALSLEIIKHCKSKEALMQQDHDYSCSPLHWAASYGHEKVVKALLAKKELPAEAFKLVGRDDWALTPEDVARKKCVDTNAGARIAAAIHAAQAAKSKR